MSMQCWHRVDNISQRKNKPHPVLNDSFLHGRKEFFAKLCQGDSHTEPLFQEIDKEKHLFLKHCETRLLSPSHSDKH